MVPKARGNVVWCRYHTRTESLTITMDSALHFTLPLLCPHERLHTYSYVDVISRGYSDDDDAR